MNNKEVHEDMAETLGDYPPIYCRELAPGTVSLTGGRAQGDDSKQSAYRTYSTVKNGVVYFRRGQMSTDNNQQSATKNHHVVGNLLRAIETVLQYSDIRGSVLPLIILLHTILTNFSTNYLVMCKVYTDVEGIK